MSARRDSMLREMGLAPIWRLRSTVAAKHGAVENHDTGTTSVLLQRPVDDAVPVERPESTSRGPKTCPLDSQNRASRIACLDWNQLETDILQCNACELCSKRKQAVPGGGDRNADWMFVGEGPGAEEDRCGEPFVGPAGQLLDAMMSAIGLKRGDEVFIANVVKCRPPLNRTPLGSEIDTCLPYLERQIALVQPRILVALGRPAAQALLGTDVRINTVRGKAFTHKGIPVVVTYHPAYLLRNQADKAKVWADLCFARRVLSGQRSD